MNIQLRALDRRELAGFRSYLLPDTQRFLELNHENLVALGAVMGNRSCGAVAAFVTGNTAVLTDLFVDETIRRCAVGSQLLNALTVQLKNRGIASITASYALRPEDLSAMDAILVKQGFSLPETVAVNYRAVTSDFRDSVLIGRAFRADYRTPADIVSFAQLPAAALEQLMGEDIPAPLSWAENRQRAIPGLSVALMIDGQAAAYQLCGESADGGCVVLAAIARNDAPPSSFLSLLIDLLNRFFYRCGGDYPVYFSATTDHVSELALRIMGDHYTRYPEHFTTFTLAR